MITLLWLGGLDRKPDSASLNDGTEFLEEEESFAGRVGWIGDQVLQEEPGPAEEGPDSWFVTTIAMPRLNTALPHPDRATVSGARGVVVALHRPHGGLVDCAGTTVFFHRSRVYLHGRHLRHHLHTVTKLKYSWELSLTFLSVCRASC